MECDLAFVPCREFAHRLSARASPLRAPFSPIPYSLGSKPRALQCLEAGVLPKQIAALRAKFRKIGGKRRSRIRAQIGCGEVIEQATKECELAARGMRPLDVSRLCQAAKLTLQPRPA